MQPAPSSHAFMITGSAEAIREVLCGPPQHDEHCKGWRWHMYTQDSAERVEAVRAECRKMIAERRARIDAAEAELEAAEAA